MSGKTSNVSKQKWNAVHYTQIKVSVNPELASAFKMKCAASGAFITSVLTMFMAGYSRRTAVRKPQAVYDTRRQRRQCVKRILLQLKAIKDAEEAFKENIPDNLRGAHHNENADIAIEAIDEAIGLLESAY